jgi:hypothetical protein
MTALNTNDSPSRKVLVVDDSKWSLTIRKADTVGGVVKVEISSP